jgi:hypothetical protein
MLGGANCGKIIGVFIFVFALGAGSSVLDIDHHVGIYDYVS